MSNASQTPAPRALSFERFDAIRQELDRLERGGYDQAGQWNLGQTAAHLADWIHFSLDGYPTTPWFFRPVLCVARHSFGPRKLRETLRNGRMPDGLPTLSETVHPIGDDESAAVDRLRRALDRLEHHTGRIEPSPMFGEVDHATTCHMHRIHCAHHLRLLVPKS